MYIQCIYSSIPLFVENLWAPGGFGSRGDRQFIFRELEGTGIFRGAEEQAHRLGDLGSPAKKFKNLTLKESLHLFYLLF